MCLVCSAENNEQVGYLVRLHSLLITFWVFIAFSFGLVYCVYIAKNIYEIKFKSRKDRKTENYLRKKKNLVK